MWCQIEKKIKNRTVESKKRVSNRKTEKKNYSQKGLLVVDDSWLYCGVTTQRDHLKGGTVLEIGNFGTLNLCFVLCFESFDEIWGSC